MKARNKLVEWNNQRCKRDCYGTWSVPTTFGANIPRSIGNSDAAAWLSRPPRPPLAMHADQRHSLHIGDTELFRDETRRNRPHRATTPPTGSCPIARGSDSSVDDAARFHRA